MSTFEARYKRMLDAMEMREPDRVPINPLVQTYPVLHAGYTVAECLYDVDKGIDAYIQFALEYEPDAAPGMAYNNFGMGPVMELQRSKTMTWAGAPDGKIGENSIHQFIEFPVLLEEDMPQFRRDYTGWLLQKGFPKTSGLLEPFADLNLAAGGLMGADMMIRQFFSRPDVLEMLDTMQKIGEMSAEINGKVMAAQMKFEDMGFPNWSGGGAGVPFDAYSDVHRGTLDSMVDMYTHRDLIEDFCAMSLENTLKSLEMQGPMMPGKWCFMALHKGMDGFMDDEQYRNLYWKDLQTIINKIIDVGMVPYIYTEGPYNSRLECLTEVPKGKVIYHFEEVDMAQAKHLLGDIACIAGGFPIYLLHYGKKQQVIDEVKRLIDICAPGGGYIFQPSAGYDHAIPENVEAMFDTVKTYGKK